MHYDVIIIGGGPGGTTAAKELAAGGKKAAIIEDKHWGGTCLNCGCIPTKMLLGATAPLGLLKAQERLRTMKGSIDIDYKALQTRVGRFLKGSSQTLAKSLAAAGITLYEGRGVCAGKGQAIVRSESGEEMLTTDNIILSCGSSSASFPGLAPDGDAVLDSTGVLNLPEVPESLIIVGAGAIGLELGDFFGMMGSKITIVEAAPHIAPTEDADIAKEMDRVQSKAGRTCITGVMAKSLVTKGGQAELTLGDGRVLTASKALVAVGRTPNTAGLDCEKAGCTLKRRGFVDVNDHLEAAEGVYAIGDVNGLTLLAHAADHQGAYVARRILGHEKGVYVPGPVPSCIYGSTEIMRVGQTAKGLLAARKSVSVSQVPLTLNPIAQAAGASGGFVKVVWTGDAIAGIAAIGHGVSHLVTVAQLLMVGGYTPERLHEVGTAESRHRYRPIGVNRTGHMVAIQVRPYVPAANRTVMWVSFGSGPFTAAAPFYANVNDTPAYLRDTTPEVSTGNLYWTNRLIAVVADAHWYETNRFIEGYAEGVRAFGHRLIERTDEQLLARSDAESTDTNAWPLDGGHGDEKDVQGVADVLEAANDEMADYLREHTTKLLNDVLYTSSNLMHNSFAMSDRWAE